MTFRAPARAALALFLAFCLTFSPNVFALGPFEKQHPLVGEGMDAYEEGRYEEALKYFEEAKKELPNSAALEFNRGNALYKLGRLEDAKAAYENVQKMDQKDLQAADHYNMGNTLARLGEKKEAIKAFRRALKLDPKDEQARHNLEVLLRDLKAPSQQQPDGGQGDGGQGDGGQQRDGGTPKQDGGLDGGEKPDGGNDGGMGQDGGTDGGSDAGSDGGSDGGQGDGGQGDAGQQKGDGGVDGGADGGEGEGQGEGEKGDAGSDGGSPTDASGDGMDAGVELLPDGGLAGMSKEEAEKLLDAMKQNEKNLQLWRFQQKKPRKQNEKDW